MHVFTFAFDTRREKRENCSPHKSLYSHCQRASSLNPDGFIYRNNFIYHKTERSVLQISATVIWSALALFFDKPVRSFCSHVFICTRLFHAVCSRYKLWPSFINQPMLWLNENRISRNDIRCDIFALNGGCLGYRITVLSSATNSCH